MPKYEIGYILSSAVSDDEVPNVTAQITKDVQSVGGNILNEDHWGRRKLAYPIGRTRNGYYAFITAELDPAKVVEVEHKLNTTDAVIRFLVVNLTEADKRKAKDAAAAVVRRQAQPAVASVEPSSEEAPTTADLDQKIEEAISSEQEQI